MIKEVSLAYVPEAGVDDYVIVHAGFALSQIDEARGGAGLRGTASSLALADEESGSMKFLDEYRDPVAAERWVKAIRGPRDRPWT